jgi:hypothetical protein
MKVVCNGTARVQHKDTGVLYEIKSQELDWNEDGMGEGPMGAESQHRAVIEHPDLGEMTWTLGEYPVGVQDHRGTDVGEHKLVEDFTYHLEHEPESPDNWR